MSCCISDWLSSSYARSNCCSAIDIFHRQPNPANSLNGIRQGGRQTFKVWVCLKAKMNPIWFLFFSVRLNIWFKSSSFNNHTYTVYPKKYAHGFCFVVVIHWLIFPYPSGLLHWHCGNLTIAPVPAKQPWWIWINTSCEFIMNDRITTTKQSTTKPCAYVLGYTCKLSWWNGHGQVMLRLISKLSHHCFR